MKQFFFRHRRNMLLQALYSGSILSLFVYAVVRILAYEFPMSWIEEIFLFVKIMLASSFIIATATGGSAWMYRNVIKMLRKAVK
ncbi:MAG TPA: hypothetical protein VF476_13205 [Chitinophagaceae bacterium]